MPTLDPQIEQIKLLLETLDVDAAANATETATLLSTVASLEATITSLEATNTSLQGTVDVHLATISLLDLQVADLEQQVANTDSLNTQYWDIGTDDGVAATFVFEQETAARAFFATEATARPTETIKLRLQTVSNQTITNLWVAAAGNFAQNDPFVSSEVIEIIVGTPA